MTYDLNPTTGLEHLVEELRQRFKTDEFGRLIAPISDGVLPRFVLGRAVEGCVWRFSSELPEGLIRSVAKLAGRERGVSILDGESTAPPERLVMICRLMRNGDELPRPQREPILKKGSIVGEFWTLD